MAEMSGRENGMENKGKNGIGHYMRRTEIKKERQRPLTGLRGQTILCYVRVGSAEVRGRKGEWGKLFLKVKEEKEVK